MLTVSLNPITAGVAISSKIGKKEEQHDWILPRAALSCSDSGLNSGHYVSTLLQQTRADDCLYKNAPFKGLFTLKHTSFETVTQCGLTAVQPLFCTLTQVQERVFLCFVFFKMVRLHMRKDSNKLVQFRCDPENI